MSGIKWIFSSRYGETWFPSALEIREEFLICVYLLSVNILPCLLIHDIFSKKVHAIYGDSILFVIYDTSCLSLNMTNSLYVCSKLGLSSPVEPFMQ